MENKKAHPPKVAITKAMIEAGLVVLEAMTTDPDEHTDDALVANVFYSMWEKYWQEIEEVRRKNRPGNAVIMPAKSKLILPGMH